MHGEAVRRAANVSSRYKALQDLCWEIFRVDRVYALTGKRGKFFFCLRNSHIYFGEKTSAISTLASDGPLFARRDVSFSVLSVHSGVERYGCAEDLPTKR